MRKAMFGAMLAGMLSLGAVQMAGAETPNRHHQDPHQVARSRGGEQWATPQRGEGGGGEGGDRDDGSYVVRSRGDNERPVVTRGGRNAQGWQQDRDTGNRRGGQDRNDRGR